MEMAQAALVCGWPAARPGGSLLGVSVASTRRRATGIVLCPMPNSRSWQTVSRGGSTNSFRTASTWQT